MDIILDANILIADYGLSGTTFRVTLDGIHRTDCKLLVPEVVIAEVVAKHGQGLMEVHDQARKVASSWRRLGRLDLAEKVIGIDVDSGAEPFGPQFDKNLLARGVGRLPWPTVSHEELVRRILLGRRPTQTEAGYRDALVWESVLTYLKAHRPAEAVLVTHNSKDFCEGERLHPHLVQDLVDAGLDPNTLTIELSLAALNKRVFEPTLALLDQAKEQLQQGKYPGLSLAAWLKKNAAELIDDEDIRHSATDLPSGCGHVGFSWEKIESFEVEDVRKLSSGDLLVEIGATITGSVSMSLDGWNYERFAKAREWMGSDYEGGDVDISMPSTVVARFELVLGSGGVLSDELVGMSGDYGEFSHIP